MATLDDAITIGRREGFLAVVSTVRADATIQSSVVNAGVLAHPVTGERVVGIVTYGRAKLANLRARPQITITASAMCPIRIRCADALSSTVRPVLRTIGTLPRRISLAVSAARSCARMPSSGFVTTMPTRRLRRAKSPLARSFT